ncbi:hypothetical protein BDD12DRAFT_898579 [Trichophaea hybrida]|nr:hypothetical protein BDD12DRAFT_898579 [Trichophaea hybrida]
MRHSSTWFKWEALLRLGVMPENYDNVVKLIGDIEKRSALYKTIKGVLFLGPTSVAMQIQQQLEAQNFTIDMDGTTVVTLKQSSAPTITLNYLNQKVVQTPDCRITNKGFDDCPWLVVEIANSQTYDQTLDKMYPYLLGSGGNIAFGGIIDLIKEKEKRRAKPSPSEQATVFIDAEFRVNTSRTLQDGLTITVKSDSNFTAKPSESEHPGSKLAIYSKATISIFKRGEELEEGASTPTSIVVPIHDHVKIFPAIPEWCDLPFAVQLSNNEKDRSTRSDSLISILLFKSSSHPPKSLLVASPKIPLALSHCAPAPHDLLLRNTK